MSNINFKEFNPVFIKARDLNDAYFSLLWELWIKGRRYKVDTGSFAGTQRLEFDYASGFINYPHTRPLAPIMPEGLLPTTTDEKLNEYFVNYLMDPTLANGEHYKYSSWLNGIDHYNEFGSSLNSKFYAEMTPIEWVIQHFKEKGYGNNQCYINIGNVDSGFNYDLPYKHEVERRTSPCFRGIDFKIKKGLLITSVIFRSWDLYAGFPENMGGFTLLNEYVANHLDGVEPGPLAFTSAGLHCYSYQLEPIMTILNKG